MHLITDCQWEFEFEWDVHLITDCQFEFEWGVHLITDCQWEFEVEWGVHLITDCQWEFEFEWGVHLITDYQWGFEFEWGVHLIIDCQWGFEFDYWLPMGNVCGPVPHDWVIKGLGMSSRVCATGHIKDPLPLVEKSRASCPGGRYPLTCILQVTVITGQNH